jgi:hypothetical protein
MSLLTAPINDITWDDVEGFCQQKTPEGAVLDYKEDFPNNLEKTLAAMANTLGGIILIGVEEDTENRPVVPVKGIEFKRGLSERVVNIILGNITPPFIPEVTVASDVNQKRALIIIRIAQSHQTPHAISGNTQVYLRTGNRNKPEELASVDHVEWLMDGRKKAEQFKDRLYKQAEARLMTLRLENVTKTKTTEELKAALPASWLLLSLCPLYPKERLVDPPAMYQVYRDSEVNLYRGQSVFPPENGSYRIVQDGFIRQSDDENTFYLELNSFGLYLYKQSIAREYPDQVYKVIWSSEICRHLDEFIDSSIKYYRLLGYWGTLEFRAALEAVKGCVLREINRNSYSPALTSPDNEIRFSTIVTAGALKEEKPRLILGAAQQIAWAFNWDLAPELLDNYYKEQRRESVLFPGSE